MGAPHRQLPAVEAALADNRTVATRGSRTARPRAAARWGTRSFLTACGIVLLGFLCNVSLADSHPPRRRGKVIIIRGALTVFSLGMNELGEKLEQHGLDVEVIADISAGRAASQLRSEYRRNGNMGPIVFIGHSRGAELGPKQARYLQRYRIPVKLVVMVDAVHPTSIPSNVERCVNLYHNNALGLIHGVPARAESKRTQLVNTDINRLASRDEGGSINHFNIDASPWIHDLVVAEVLKVCPPVESKTATAAKSAPATTRRPATAARPAPKKESTPAVAQPRSKSGLQYPSGIAGGLWSESAGNRASPSPQRAAQPGSRQTRPSQSQGNRVSSTGRTNSAQRWGVGNPSRSRTNSTTRSTNRTAARPYTSKTPKTDSSTGRRSGGSSGRESTTVAPQRAGSTRSLRSDPAEQKTDAPKLKQPESTEKKPSAADKSESETKKSDQKKGEPIQIQLKG